MSGNCVFVCGSGSLDLSLSCLDIHFGPPFFGELSFWIYPLPDCGVPLGLLRGGFIPVTHAIASTRSFQTILLLLYEHVSLTLHNLNLIIHIVQFRVDVTQTLGSCLLLLQNCFLFLAGVSCRFILDPIFTFLSFLSNPVFTFLIDSLLLCLLCCLRLEEQ